MPLPFYTVFIFSFLSLPIFEVYKKIAREPLSLMRSEWQGMWCLNPKILKYNVNHLKNDLKNKSAYVQEFSRDGK